jgi:hypothetical protein
LVKNTNLPGNCQTITFPSSTALTRFGPFYIYVLHENLKKHMTLQYVHEISISVLVSFYKFGLILSVKIHIFFILVILQKSPSRFVVESGTWHLRATKRLSQLNIKNWTSKKLQFIQVSYHFTSEFQLYKLVSVFKLASTLLVGSNL